MYYTDLRPRRDVAGLVLRAWSARNDNVVERMIYETNKGVDIIASDSGLSGADNNLGSAPVEKRYLKIDSFVDEYLAEQYDIVLFDLAGKEDNITLNGIVAATNLISPACPG